MNLYKLTQDTCTGFDTFKEILVAAKNPEDAVNINPKGVLFSDDSDDWNHGYSWAFKPSDVKAERIGEASTHIVNAQVVMVSFNAG